MVDPVRIQQVLWNIVRNAVKFTPRGGRIRIASEASDVEFVVTCADNGVGIEAEALSRIFLAYEQASLDTYQRFGGLGLGLAISMGIVASHGGRLEAASEGRDRGATFTLRLPLANCSPGLTGRRGEWLLGAQGAKSVIEAAPLALLQPPS